MSETEFYERAFPVPLPFKENGMSLRDWFAGQALAGMLCKGWMPDTIHAKCGYDRAAAAYAMADEMLKARKPK